MNDIKLDIICPVYWIDEMFFERNVESWIKELPINDIYLGINNPKITDYILKLIPNVMKKKINMVHIDDQTHLKTLGACLRDLMKIVNTEWFVYLHSDAFITPYAFEIMKNYMKPEVGIIESERFHWDGATSYVYNQYIIPSYTYDNYYNIDRAFSGFQIFQKKAVQSIIDKIEDDYIYRNEDLIFQYECLMNGYIYKKTLGMHIHQIFNKKWTFPEAEANLMQVKGLIKYTEPLPRITKEVFLNVLKHLKSHKIITIYEILKFCDKLKKKYWKRLILKKWDEL